MQPQNQHNLGRKQARPPAWSTQGSFCSLLMLSFLAFPLDEH